MTDAHEGQSQRRFADGHWWQWDATEQRWVMEPAAPGASEAPVEPDAHSASPVSPVKSRRPLLIGAIAVALVLLVAIAASVAVTAKRSSDQAAAEQAAEDARLAREQVLAQASSTCDLNFTSGATLGDGGRTLTLDTQGEDDSSGVSIEKVACVLSTVDTPDAVLSALDSTRALDGRQRASWDNIDAEWSYHPNSGLNLILTTTGSSGSTTG